MGAGGLILNLCLELWHTEKRASWQLLPFERLHSAIAADCIEHGEATPLQQPFQ